MIPPAQRMKPARLVPEALLEVVADINLIVTMFVDEKLLMQAEGGAADFLDYVNGSRGLLHDHVIPWAFEFQAEYERRAAAGEAPAENYLADIDDFARLKVAALIAFVNIEAAALVTQVVEDVANRERVEIRATRTVELDEGISVVDWCAEDVADQYSIYTGRLGAMTCVADFAMAFKDEAIHFAMNMADRRSAGLFKLIGVV